MELFLVILRQSSIYKEYINSYISHSTNTDNEEKIEAHKRLIFLINQHLGIESFSADLLYYCISQTTELFLNKHEFLFPTLQDARKEMAYKHFRTINKTSLFCTKIDNTPIPSDNDELRLFVIARNESLRLPHFFYYYSKLGVDRFFLIDNNSTDNTCEIALSHHKVHVFKINRSYKEHWNWMEYFLNKYGMNRWCVVVDADELLHYPYSEYVPLKQLICYLQENNFTALKSTLLDIHSNKPIAATEYSPGMNPLDVCDYFDPSISIGDAVLFDKKRWDYFNSTIYHGGVRSNVFIGEGSRWFNLTKFSLFQYTEDIYLAQGMHGINGARIADIEGAVIHTKFLSDLKKRAYEESIREEHFKDAMEYKIYNNSMDNNEFLSLNNEKSVKYENTEQLVGLGVMKCSDTYINFTQERGNS